MSDSKQLSLSILPKLAVIATLSYGLNYLIQRMLKPKPAPRRMRRLNTTMPEFPRSDSYNDILNDELLKS